MDKKFRTFQIDGLKVRKVNGATLIEGHAALFDTHSEPLWDLFGAREIIKPGAFRRAVEQDDVRLLINHDPNLVLARNTSGTLTLKEDEKGLFYSAKLPDTSYANDLVAVMKRGDVNQNSFGFVVTDGAWETHNGEEVHVVNAVRLFDVSVVTFPAYVETDAQVRSVAAALTRETPTDEDRRLVKTFLERCGPFCAPLNTRESDPEPCGCAARAQRERELAILEME